MSTGSSASALHDTGGSSRDRVSGIHSASSSQALAITTRHARSEDIVGYFGEPQIGTVQAYVAEADGKVVGVIGIIREFGYGRYFCDFRPELQPYLRSIPIMRLLKKSMSLVKAYRGPLISVAEHGEGCRILNRLGFTHLEGAVYAWLK